MYQLAEKPPVVQAIFLKSLTPQLRISEYIMESGINTFLQILQIQIALSKSRTTSVGCKAGYPDSVASIASPAPI